MLAGAGVVLLMAGVVDGCGVAGGGVGRGAAAGTRSTIRSAGAEQVARESAGQARRQAGACSGEELSHVSWAGSGTL